MTNKDFYAFCRDERKVEKDKDKKEALTSVYNYMRECSVTKSGVTNFIEHMKKEKPHLAEAYTWLQNRFTGRMQAIQEIALLSQEAGEY